MKTKEGPSNLFPNQNRPSIFTFSKIPYARDSLKNYETSAIVFLSFTFFRHAFCMHRSIRNFSCIHPFMLRKGLSKWN